MIPPDFSSLPAALENTHKASSRPHIEAAARWALSVWEGPRVWWCERNEIGRAAEPRRSGDCWSCWRSDAGCGWRLLVPLEVE